VPIILSLHYHCGTSSSTLCAIIVILIVINKFFSSFNGADPSHIMLVDFVECFVAGSVAP
jgi:hypothetical protein